MVAIPSTNSPDAELKAVLLVDKVNWHDKNTRDSNTNEPVSLQYQESGADQNTTSPPTAHDRCQNPASTEPSPMVTDIPPPQVMFTLNLIFMYWASLDVDFSSQKPAFMHLYITFLRDQMRIVHLHFQPNGSTVLFSRCSHKDTEPFLPVTVLKEKSESTDQILEGYTRKQGCNL
ncbi:hypothetical protein BGW42_005435 [Actinomortierella wolfii]|nr:hypothetical protein BGW42_005435 [Actinomortierella wolfii]